MVNHNVIYISRSAACVDGTKFYSELFLTLLVFMDVQSQLKRSQVANLFFNGMQFCETYFATKRLV